ncbi:MAG TPA: hypothetical protein VD789_09140 [Thermomicrobiales bacterium]|nr:hypothetical protein [Thermomicrobiales bacterium]
MSIVIEPDLREVGDQKFALDVVVGRHVERAGLLQQVQVVQDHVVLLLDDVHGGREPLPQVVPLHLELAQPVAHLVGGQVTVGGEIEQ